MGKNKEYAEFLTKHEGYTRDIIAYKLCDTPARLCRILR